MGSPRNGKGKKGEGNGRIGRKRGWEEERKRKEGWKGKEGRERPTFETLPVPVLAAG